MSDVTKVLADIEHGDPSAAEQLLPLVYAELRKLAAAKLANEKPGQTLQATALVHEAFIRLLGPEQASWNGSGHFFGTAAEAMRRILIDNARRKQAEKRGGDLRRVDLEAADIVCNVRSDKLLALDEALRQLEAQDRQSAQLVKLRYFAGLTMPQAAEVLGISLRSAERNWTYAKTWLHAALADDDSPPAN